MRCRRREAGVFCAGGSTQNAGALVWIIIPPSLLPYLPLSPLSVCLSISLSAAHAHTLTHANFSHASLASFSLSESVFMMCILYTTTCSLTPTGPLCVCVRSCLQNILNDIVLAICAITPLTSGVSVVCAVSYVCVCSCCCACAASVVVRVPRHDTHAQSHRLKN